jgi:hypothetical protein
MTVGMGAARAAGRPPGPANPMGGGVQVLGAGLATDPAAMLYSSMKHRTQLYLNEGQYRWLRQRAGSSGSIAAVVRGLIDAERARLADPAGDPLLRFLVEESPGRGREGTSVSTLDHDLYGG